MAKTAVITDSACDLERNRLESLGVACVPLTVSFGGRVYADGVDLTRDEFYHLLTTSKETATTAQPSPAAFAALYDKALRGADRLLVICLSAKLSGTYESALAARSERRDAERIIVFDSRAASIGQALMVYEAAERAAAGQEVGDILGHLEIMRNKLASVFILDTLEYLVRGGRLSRVQGFVGSVLNVKPVLELDTEGGIVPREKVRGRRKAIDRLLEIVRAEGGNLAGARLGVCHARAEREAEELAEVLRKRFLAGKVIVGEIAATIGSHVGPGCLAVFFPRR